MNKILIALISVALVTGCTGKQTPKDTHDHEAHEACQSHDDHDHAAEGHNHEAEGHDHERENLDHQHEGKAGHPAGEIVFTKEQAAETDFALHKVEPTTFYEVIPASGQILAAQGDEATVVATVSGVVSFSSKKLSEGASVSRGENLFYISSKNIAEGDYTARTRAAFAQAKAAYERAEELVKDKIISQSEYEQAKLNYQNAKTAQEAVANKTTAKGTGVGAPIGGFIKNIAVSEGQFVEVGQLLATISQNRRLKLKAEVSQRYHGALPTISSANFKTSYDDKTYSLKDLGGRLVSVGKASDGASAYIPVTFEFDNKGGIVSGSFVEVFLISQTEHADRSGHGADRRTGQLLGFRPDRRGWISQTGSKTGCQRRKKHTNSCGPRTGRQRRQPRSLPSQDGFVLGCHSPRTPALNRHRHAE